MQSGLLPEGFRDRLPPHADAAAALMRRILDSAHSHGYERVAPPLAEFADGLTARLKGTREVDLMRLTDPVSQRTLALRPDLTAQVGRIAATRMAHHPRPLRLSYGGQVVKLRASQLRPEREMLQVGCELIGLDTVAAAREVVTVAVEALAAADVGALTVDFTLPDLVDSLADALPVTDAARVRDLLDAKDAGAIAAEAPAYSPLIAAAGPIDSALERLRAFDSQGQLASRLDGVAAVAEAIADKARLTLDPTERHGFEFQRWLGFSFFVDGVAGEVGRGGTYAIVHPDGREEPAVGFSLYLDPLVDAGLAVGARRRLFVPADADPATAATLRAQGWVTVAALGDGDSAERQLCTHVLTDGAPRAL